MELDLEDILMFPFKKDNWKKPFLTVFVAFFVLTGLTSLLSIPLQFIPYFTQETPEIGVGVMLIFLTIFLFLSLLLVPLSIYLTGYQLKLYNYIRKEEKDLPQHTNIWETFVNGLKVLFINIVYMLPLSLLVILASVIIVIAMLLGFAGPVGVMMSFIVMTVVPSVFFLAFFALIIALSFVVICADYEFLRTGSVKAALNFKRTWEYTKLMWKDILVAYAIYIAITMITTTLSFFVFCIGFIAQPLLYTYYIFLSGKIYGTLFKKMDAIVEKVK